MLVTRQDILSLKILSNSKDLVEVNKIPDAFKVDFQNFFFGKTLVKDKDTICAYPHDIKMWVNFIFNKYKD